MEREKGNSRYNEEVVGKETGRIQEDAGGRIHYGPELDGQKKQQVMSNLLII